MQTFLKVGMTTGHGIIGDGLIMQLIRERKLDINLNKNTAHL